MFKLSNIVLKSDIWTSNQFDKFASLTAVYIKLLFFVLFFITLLVFFYKDIFSTVLSSRTCFFFFFLIYLLIFFFSFVNHMQYKVYFGVLVRLLKHHRCVPCAICHIIIELMIACIGTSHLTKIVSEASSFIGGVENSPN